MVHEWGTFTVLQDSHGEPIPGVNINEETLPAFVHRLAPNLAPESNELAPVFNPSRYSTYVNRRGKGIRRGYRLAIMRMETPIIYFYPPGDEQMTLDVSVQFRKGWLSEWYPDAENKSPGYPEALGEDAPGSLTWKDLKVGVESEIPRTDEHVWLAPREVDSARVQTSGEQPQTEQYLFYRGVAQLRSPIRVVTEDNGKRLDLWNQPQPGTKGEQPINDLWLADIRPDGKVAFRTIDSVVIESASAKALTRTAGSFEEGEYDTANLAQLRTSMHEAIMSAGLFEDEATAMLNTWELSYFKSAGMRLFFILPDAWTDYQLPLKISEPADITRVMIGRVELITQQQHELLSAIAAGPASTPSWLTERLDKVPPELRTSLWQDLQTGARKLSTLEDFEVPADYKAYINLGRFRDAIVLSGARDNGALAQFAKNYRIALN